MEVLIPMRRILCAITLAALLAALLSPAALAITGQEALFGSDSPDGDQAGDAAGQTRVKYPILSVDEPQSEEDVPFIVMLQNRLIELGYLRDAADGIYGESTRQAVYEFQKYNNLPETGVADGETQKLLQSDISKLAAALSDNSQFGSELTHVQNVLALWGFYGGTVDGISGSNTELAIVNFKAYIRKFDPDFGVTPTPMPTATPNPNGLFSDMPTVVDELLTPEPEPTTDPLTDASLTPAVMDYMNGEYPFEIFRQTIFNGDSGDEALRVQTRLKNLKYVYKADGAFGDVSEMGLKYFQRKNGLAETGIADESTQRALFSENAIPAEEYVFPYKLVVDVSDQRVYAVRWTGSGYEGKEKTFVCSTGKDDTPTPIGIYQAQGKTGDEWYWFKGFHCYARWAYRILNGILFHSITYDEHKHPQMSEDSLGHKAASHGCVRLKVADAKWIYFNCPEGTTVVVQE